MTQETNMKPETNIKLETIEILRRVMHDSMGYMRAKLENFGLYRGQPKMLFMLNKEDGLTKKELAQKFEVAAPTITKMVERLEKKGFIHTRKDEKDRRITRVYIGDQGRNVVKDLISFHDEASEIYFKDMTEEEVETLNTLLKKVKSNINEVHTTCHSHRQKHLSNVGQEDCCEKDV